MVAMSAGEVGGKTVTEKDIMDRPPEMVPLPLRNISALESIVTRFRIPSITCDEGGIATHGGCGSRFAVSMRWKDRHACIDAVELLAAWVETFSPEDAKDIRAAALSYGKEEPLYVPQPQEEEDADDADT